MIIVEIMAICVLAVVCIQVLDVLSSLELFRLIYKIVAASHSKFSDSLSCYLDHVLKCVPTIYKQLQFRSGIH